MDSSAWDERYASSELIWSRQPNVFVERELTGLRPGHALDLGCGEGRNAIWLAGQGWQVTAIDFSFVAINKARRLSATAEVAVDWRVDDVLTAELPRHLDLVLVAYLQLPAHERREALRRGFAALRPGGTLLVVAHDSSNLSDGTGGPPDASVLYTADEAAADLAGLDPQIEQAAVVDREVEGERPAKDALLRARRGPAESAT